MKKDLNIYEEYKEVEKTIQKLIKNNEDFLECEFTPLATEVRKEVKIELSAGGPSDGFKIYVDKNNEIEEVIYYYSEWFNYQEYRLSEYEIEKIEDWLQFFVELASQEE
ncbi:MAG: hypothetical protein RMI01_10185 [Thermodesulfovibrio sp.]|nr:hypothetical protein [Thermodesulfovibrio sp.]